MSIEELEPIVSGLTESDLSRFSEWFEEFMAQQWDKEIERDLTSGRLDAALQRADDHYKAGRCTPL